MHMADALISPEVGGIMWAVSGGALLYSARKMEKTPDDFKVPLMGVMGAFIFAAQMINFTIPGTGSSGHICGSILLAVLLGPYAALIVVSSVLLVQALIFADGGLLALGCNIFNMGLLPALIAYPLIYKTIAGKSPSGKRLWFAAVLASTAGLQLGALGVVIETCSSGVSAIPFQKFLLLMLPIHLAIGFIEGIITASALSLIREMRPELVAAPLPSLQREKNAVSNRAILTFILIASLITGGVISWFASENPDGLEWAEAKTVTQQDVPQVDTSLHRTSEKIQETTAIMPDYGLPAKNSESDNKTVWGSAAPATSLAGIIGSLITLILAVILGMLFRKSVIPKTRQEAL